MKPVKIEDFGVDLVAKNLDGNIICPHCKKEFTFVVYGTDIKELAESLKKFKKDKK